MTEQIFKCKIKGLRSEALKNLNWLNLGIDSYKMNCKDLFLNPALVA